MIKSFTGYATSKNIHIIQTKAGHVQYASHKINASSLEKIELCVFLMLDEIQIFNVNHKNHHITKGHFILLPSFIVRVTGLYHTVTAHDYATATNRKNGRRAQTQCWTVCITTFILYHQVTSPA